MTIEVKVFSDYICPFCYIGKGLLDRLSEEYALRVTWLGFELHPETPTQGLSMAERFPDRDLTKMYDALNARGAELGLDIKPVEVLSNSRLALEAAEFARDQGRFASFHAAVFDAYFGQGLDIGRFRVLRQVATDLGLDTAALREALEHKTYAERLSAVRDQALEQELTGLPTFVVNDRHRIVGAQPLEAFREVFSRETGASGDAEQPGDQEE